MDAGYSEATHGVVVNIQNLDLVAHYFLPPRRPDFTFSEANLVPIRKLLKRNGQHDTPADS